MNPRSLADASQDPSRAVEILRARIRRTRTAFTDFRGNWRFITQGNLADNPRTMRQMPEPHSAARQGHVAVTTVTRERARLRS